MSLLLHLDLALQHLGKTEVYTRETKGVRVWFVGLRGAHPNDLNSQQAFKLYIIVSPVNNVRNEVYLNMIKCMVLQQVCSDARPKEERASGAF